ncbi:two-component system sensor histidine kinase NtrB [Neorhizobium petrolearium]|uniref:two-component system sensor histidine kinase NtrB n=1 Tax=Neorhizobium petrolearium TaxID=515361 RepID=UPI003F166EDD
MAAEEHLAGISQLSFQRLIENIADGVLVVDLSGDVLYANPAAAQIFGQPVEKLLHVPLGRPVVSGETAELTVPRPGKPPAEVEMRVVELGWDGHAALLASLRDVSAQRAADERRRQSQKMEAIGRLAAGIIHDFNNLLTVFDSGVKLLERQLKRDPAHPNVNLLLDQLRKRIENGGALTQQMLAFSRRQALAPETIDINERVESLTRLLEQTLGSEVTVCRNLTPELGEVHIDANQLDVAILNLAVNARDAMEGRGTLTIETGNASGELEDMDTATTSFVRVTVRDSGCGMSQETLAQVFEPFFTTKPEGEGTGLGLSQVYGFVHQSGGHVRIDSSLGKGTSVHLFLPYAGSR